MYYNYSYNVQHSVVNFLKKFRGKFQVENFPQIAEIKLQVGIKFKEGFRLICWRKASSGFLDSAGDLTQFPFHPFLPKTEENPVFKKSDKPERFLSSLLQNVSEDRNEK